MVSCVKKTKKWDITDSLDQDMATCLFVKFKDFGIVKLLWVTYLNEKYKGFFF